jgi:cytochrome c oxidase subunit 4
MAHVEQTEGRLIPARIYLRVGAALLILTAITVIVAQVPLGGWNLVVALTIATLKAMLVAMFFMHLLYDNRLYLLIVSTALATLLIFIVLTLFDTLDRGLITREVAYPIRPQAVFYKQDTTATDTTQMQTPETGTADTSEYRRYEAEEERH